MQKWLNPIATGLLLVFMVLFALNYVGGLPKVASQLVAAYGLWVSGSAPDSFTRPAVGRSHNILTSPLAHLLVLAADRGRLHREPSNFRQHVHQRRI